MANRDEALAVFGVLCAAFNTETENDPEREDLWIHLLADINPGQALEVAEMYIKGEKFFPKPAEFLTSVKELVRRDALKQTQSARTQAAFRCDGSRWRCVKCKSPECMCERTGLEPCPTCNPVLYGELTDETKNRQWRSGARMERDDILVAPKEPCSPHETESVIEPKVGLAHLHKANMDDWSNTRRDVM